MDKNRWNQYSLYRYRKKEWGGNTFLHVLGCLESVFAKDRRPTFAKITTPTLIFWGVKDIGQPIKEGRNLAKMMQNAKLIEVQNSGHNAPTEQPKLFSTEIIKFFR